MWPSLVKIHLSRICYPSLSANKKARVNSDSRLVQSEDVEITYGQLIRNVLHDLNF